jgi:hypothetical protein
MSSLLDQERGAEVAAAASTILQLWKPLLMSSLLEQEMGVGVDTTASNLLQLWKSL